MAVFFLFLFLLLLRDTRLWFVCCVCSLKMPVWLSIPPRERGMQWEEEEEEKRAGSNM